jgi:hypothetical protein
MGLLWTVSGCSEGIVEIEKPRKFRIATIEKKKNRGKKRLTHKTTAHFHHSVWPWRA